MSFLLFSVRPCASSPCVNGGECENLKTSYQCKCPAGFKGKRCQIKGTGFLYMYNQNFVFLYFESLCK